MTEIGDTDRAGVAQQIGNLEAYFQYFMAAKRDQIMGDGGYYSDQAEHRQLPKSLSAYGKPLQIYRLSQPMVRSTTYKGRFFTSL